MNTFSSIYLLAWVIIHAQPATAQPMIVGTDLQDEIQAHSQSHPAQSFSWADIMQKPNLQQVKLSPDGKRLAYLLREPQGVSLWLMDTASKQQRQLFHSLLLKNIYWASNSQRIFLHSAVNLAYINLGVKAGPVEVLIKFDEHQDESFYDLDSASDDHVLLRRTVKESGQHPVHQLLRRSISGDEHVLFSGPKQVHDHLFNAQGELAFVRYAGDSQHHIYQLINDTQQLVFSAAVIDKVRMVRFDQASNELLLVAYHDNDLLSLHALNIKTGHSRVVHQDPEQTASLFSLVVDRHSQKPLLVSYFTDREKTYALEADWATDVDIIHKHLSGSVSIQASQEAAYWLVRQHGAHIGHSQYHLYDVAKQQLSPVLQTQRAAGSRINAADLAAAIPVTYTASDGMRIHGYVMLPRGVDLQQVPLLVHVHGGPYNRVHGGHSPWQYLVNQGYALFMPNFRASKGYGLQYMIAGKAAFSGRVQQDIIDGVEYLLSQGISQRGQLGVFGHSFGGYSVLALLSNYPGYFKVGLASAAPTELLSTLFKMDQKDINRYDGVPLRAALSILMVDLENEQQLQQMQAQSPSARWQAIQEPLLIWAGALDQRVPINDVRDHAIKLQQAGKDVTLVIDQQTGHNFHADDQVGQKAFRFMVEDFFARHFNQPRPEPSASTQTYLQRYKVY